MKDLFGDYSAIIMGLVVGSLAHFGRLVTEGRMPTPIQIIGFFMQLGLVGLVAAVVTKKIGMTDTDVRALTTAILAVSTQEVVQYAKKKAWRAIVDAADHHVP